MKANDSKAWLVNTGWVGGGYGDGSRIKLKYTRAIIDAIHNGTLSHSEMVKDEVFGLEIPLHCAGVPDEIMVPRNSWKDKPAYDKTAAKLAGMFKANFGQFEAGCDIEIVNAGPKV